jgi:hypothetical protein
MCYELTLQGKECWISGEEAENTAESGGISPFSFFIHFSDGETRRAAFDLVPSFYSRLM